MAVANGRVYAAVALLAGIVWAAAALMGIWLGSVDSDATPSEPASDEGVNADPHDGYPDSPVDLDCDDFDGPVEVPYDDPDGLDKDGDGIGCEPWP
jgi:hypothetical protein